MTAVVGSYITTQSPQTIAGLVLQSETRVLIGKNRLFGSLEGTSAMYLAYSAAIGMMDGTYFDVGELTGLGFEHVPSFTPPDATNVLTSSLEILEEQETTISMSVMQFDIRTLEVAVGTGIVYTTGPGGNERLMVVGEKCRTARRPLQIEATNIGCNAPDSVGSVLNGISAIVITVYDAQCTSGLPWSDIVAGELNVLDLEFLAKPVRSLPSTNNLWNMYMF